MKHSLWLASLAALMTTAAVSSAQAEERWPRWYLGVNGDLTFLQDADISGAVNGSGSFDYGWGATGTIGYLPSSSAPLLNSLRFEVEVERHENDNDSFSAGATSASDGGHYRTTAYMINTFYDFGNAFAGWTPYIGGGIGFADIRLSVNNAAIVTDDSDKVFAYQGMFGFGYSPASIPNTQWTIGYRYLGTEDPRFSTAGGNIETEYSSHSLEVGAKFRF